ncbi:MAG TPA: VOC family protein [Xanthomonadaceae bacterium]|nr:VOC family protein [Xanthomonadaceae bacterium]
MLVHVQDSGSAASSVTIGCGIVLLIETGTEVVKVGMANRDTLMSSNVVASLGFYERLGFSVKFQDNPADPKYAAIARDRVELHLQWQDASQWAHPIDRPTYRFVVQDVDALYAELHARDAVDTHAIHRSPWLTPADTPWGTREFHVRDPDGNGLQFYRSL